MKKLISVMLAASLALSLAACGSCFYVFRRRIL